MSDSESTKGTSQQSQEATGGESKQSGGFVPPKSQEEFDRIIQERVARAKASAADEVRKSYEGFKSAEEFKQLQDKYDTAAAELGNEYRKSAAAEAGLPLSMADRLQGESREEWFNDAKSIAEQFAGLASAESEKSEEQQSGGSSPRSNPREQRGQTGGNPGADMDISVDDVLKNVNRF